ncbi:MAG: Cys-tRNA(Pro) deacylase [Lysinibacillus sp.]|nr:Cys-tRNA(Pro) deacylase [Lysinibacillus sp.]
MAKKKLAKTNAVRLLDHFNVNYELLSYEVSDDVDGISVANKIGHSVSHVYKTLVTCGGGKFFVFVIPVSEELDLKATARISGEKKIDMLPLKDLLATTGYVRGGCSPIGMKKQFPTFIDESAKELEYMIVSAGKIGMQIKLAPKDLERITGGMFAPVTKG